MNPYRRERYRRILARYLAAGVPETDVRAVIVEIKDDCSPYALTLALDALVPGGRLDDLEPVIA